MVYGEATSSTPCTPSHYLRPRHIGDSLNAAPWATMAPARNFHDMRRTNVSLRDKPTRSSPNGSPTPPGASPPTLDGNMTDDERDGCSGDKMLNAVQEYCRSTSLHGLRYVGDVTNSPIERLFWIAAFALAVVTSAYFISNLYHKWETSPVINSISPEATSVVDIPFPALTICNVNKARRSIVTRFNDNEDPRMEKVQKHLLSDLCDRDEGGSIDVTNHDSSDSEVERFVGDWNVVMSFMVNVSQPCHEMLILCQWHGEVMPCEDLFNPSLTDEGICCSFNRVKRDLIFRNPRELSDLNITFPYPSADWTPEQGYPENATIDQTPWRPWGVGAHLGLTLTLDAELDEYYCSSTVGVGFKMVLHNPVETPKVSAFGSFISPGEETRVILTPVISHAAPSLSSVSEEKRQCVFSNERYLQFYRTYTQRNCVLECEANFTLRQCQCVSYHMPKDKFTRICGKNDELCADRARMAMELRLVNGAANLTHLNITNVPSCHCLPGCSELSYTFTKSSSEFSASIPPTRAQWTQNRNVTYLKNNMAVVTFFFTETLFPSRFKSELFGFTEFLSNTGGLLGLFLGFSFLSAVEAFYFLSLRLYCSWSRMHTEEIIKENMRNKAKESRVVPYPFAQ